MPVRTLLYSLEILIQCLNCWPYRANIFEQIVRNILHKFYNFHCMCQAKFVTLFFVVTVLTLLHPWECTLWKGLKFVQNHLVIFDEMIILSMNHHTLLNCGCVCVCHSLLGLLWGTCFGQRNNWISYKWRHCVPSESLAEEMVLFKHIIQQRNQMAAQILWMCIIWWTCC
jgi:hypothetical protein